MKPALRILAGPVARAQLRERGLTPADVLAVPGAAGGPKGLILNPLDRFLFGHWLAGEGAPVHLLGASIGAWRMASACLPDADAALAEMFCVPQGTPLLYLDELDYDKEGMPMLYSPQYYIGGVIQHTMLRMKF